MKNGLNSYNNKKCTIKMNINSEIELYKIPLKALKTAKLSDFNGLFIYQLLIEMMKDSKNLNLNNIKYSNNENNFFSPKTKPRNIVITSNSARNKNRARQTSGYFNYSNQNFFINLNPFKIERIFFQIKYDTKFGEDISVIGSIYELGNWESNRALKMSWNDGNIWKGELYSGSNNISEFEYKFILVCGGQIKKWEEGSNRKFNLLQIKSLIEAYPGNYSHIYLKSIEGKDICFNIDDNSLTIICFWNIK